MLRRHLLVLASALSTLAACSGTTAPAGQVVAVATPAGIEGTNGTSRPIFYAAAANEIVPLWDYIQCVDATRCATIPPGERGTLPWSQVAGFAADRHVYRYVWWQAPSPAGPGISGAVEVVR